MQRIAPWVLLVAGLFALDRSLASAPAPFRMIAFVGLALAAMKWLVWAVEQAHLPWASALAFGFAWPGMRPKLFAHGFGRARPGAGRLLARGLLQGGLGALLLLWAGFVWRAHPSMLVLYLLALPGLSLMLHFGACHVLTALYRSLGIACDPLFRAPLFATSLSEFWSRRWNLAFSEMTATVLYRPLAARAGRQVALLASFALSGLLHELAISLPVRAGFGLPFAYFMLHGFLVSLERRFGIRGRAWTLFWLAAPLPLLFHPPFVNGIVRPLVVWLSRCGAP